MRKQFATESAPSLSSRGPRRILTVLSVSPLDADHASLEAVISHSSWTMFKAHDLRAASTLLHQHEIAVAICERDLPQGSWTDLLQDIETLPHAPSLIVASRLADDSLWAQALNLGAWDVLAKPFDHTELIRSVKSGWQRWYDRLFSAKPPYGSAATAA
jgi:DNA-binding response OmpR family regulator